MYLSQADLRFCVAKNDSSLYLLNTEINRSEQHNRIRCILHGELSPGPGVYTKEMTFVYPLPLKLHLLRRKVSMKDETIIHQITIV